MLIVTIMPGGPPATQRQRGATFIEYSLAIVAITVILTLGTRFFGNNVGYSVFMSNCKMEYAMSDYDGGGTLSTLPGGGVPDTSVDHLCTIAAAEHGYYHPVLWSWYQQNSLQE